MFLKTILPYFESDKIEDGRHLKQTVSLAEVCRPVVIPLYIYILALPVYIYI